MRNDSKQVWLSVKTFAHEYRNNVFFSSFPHSPSAQGSDQSSELPRAGAPSEGRLGGGVHQRSCQIYEERRGVHKETQWKATCRMMTQHWCSQLFAFFLIFAQRTPLPPKSSIHLDVLFLLSLHCFSTLQPLHIRGLCFPFTLPKRKSGTYYLVSTFWFGLTSFSYFFLRKIRSNVRIKKKSAVLLT